MAIYEPDIDQSDVFDALAACVPGSGDIVRLPDDTEGTWQLGAWDTGGIIVPPGCILEGYGVGRTIINFSVASDSPYMQMIGGVGAGITGVDKIEFRETDSIQHVRGVVALYGSGDALLRNEFRLSKCKFHLMHSHSFQANNAIGCVCQNIFNGAGNTFFGIVNNPNWKGVGDFGDNSWATPMNYGSQEFLFVEKNTLTYPDYHYGLVDAHQGGRLVFRRNTCLNGFTGIPHGTETGGRHRSARGGEFYQNTMQAEDTPGFSAIKAFHFRGGTGLVWGNVLTGVWNYPIVGIAECYRIIDIFGVLPPFPGWYGCDGENDWDVNDPVVYATGTHVGANGASVLTANGSPGWTVNEWVGYQIVNCSWPPGTVRRPSNIIANTAGTITNNPVYHSSPMVWNVGDVFEIRKVTKSIDMPGLGQCDYLTGGEGCVPVVLNHAISPIHAWANTLNGVGVPFIPGHPIIVDGVHIKNEVPEGYAPAPYPHELNDDVPVPTPPLAPGNMILTPLPL